MNIRRFLFLAFFACVSPAAATTVYTAGTINTQDSGDTGLDIRIRVNPGASSAGGTLSITFGAQTTGTVSAFTSSGQFACLTAGSGSTVYNCTSSQFALTCSGPNSSSGNISLPSGAGGAGATVTCTTASNFPSFTSSNVIMLCVQVTSANAPYSNNGTPVLGTFLGFAGPTHASSPCSNTSPGLSDTGTTIRYYLNNIVSNAPSGATSTRLLLGVGL